MVRILKKKVLEEALPFRRAYDNAAGTDVCGVRVIEKKKDSLGREVTYVSTGWSLEIPPTHFVEIHERSSLHKSSWGLANKCGVIDSDYRGPLILALVSSVPTSDLPPLNTPIVQLIVRKKEDTEWVEVDSLSATRRGEGGFGSSDTAELVRKLDAITIPK